MSLFFVSYCQFWLNLLFFNLIYLIIAIQFIVSQYCFRERMNHMDHFTVYWPLDVINDLRSANDQGPIKVIYGSIHSRMPSIVSIKEGDIVYPVIIFQKHFYVLARLPVEHKEYAFHYLLRELGQHHSALIPDGFALECQDIDRKSTRLNSSH